MLGAPGGGLVTMGCAVGGTGGVSPVGSGTSCAVPRAVGGSKEPIQSNSQSAHKGSIARTSGGTATIGLYPVCTILWQPWTQDI